MSIVGMVRTIAAGGATAEGVATGAAGAGGGIPDIGSDAARGTGTGAGGTKKRTSGGTKKSTVPQGGGILPGADTLPNGTIVPGGTPQPGEQPGAPNAAAAYLPWLLAAVAAVGIGYYLAKQKKQRSGKRSKTKRRR